MENNNNLEAHYKSLQEDSKFLGAWNVEPRKQDKGNKIIATIDKIVIEDVIDLKKTIDAKKPVTKSCMTCYFKEANLKTMILNKTNQKAIAKVSESNYVNDWAGKKITIYVKHNMNVAGNLVDGLRIQDYAPVDKLICEECGDIIQAYGTVTAEKVAEASHSKYGSQLCITCATARKAVLEGNE